VIAGINFLWTDSYRIRDLTFVDPCIVVKFVKKIQQDATTYQNFYYSVFI